MTRVIAGLSASFLVLLAVTFVFNWFVDGHGFFGRNPFGSFQDGQARHFKAAVIGDYPHDVTIIGTSKTVQIDPDAIDECRVYNASFNGARPEEILYFIERFLPADKFALIGLDLFIFRDEPIRDTTFGRWTVENLTSFGLSTQALRYNYKTLQNWRKNKIISLKFNGARYTDHMVANDETLQEYDYAHYFNVARNHIYNDFRLSEARFEILENMRRLLEDRGQPYAVFINPVAPAGVQFFRDVDVEHHFEEFRRRVKEIFPGVYDFTEGAYANDDDLFYKTDPLHYLPAVGRRFIGDILADHGCRPAPGSAARSVMEAEG